MSLQSEIEEMKKQLAETPAEEVEEEEIVEEATEGEDAEEVEEKTESPAEKENDGEEKKEVEAEKVEEEKPDHAAFAKMRRDKAAAEKRAEDAEARASKMVEKEPVESEETQPHELPPEVAELLADHQMTKAEREFQDFEAEVLRKNKDYPAVAEQYSAVIEEGIRARNPLKSDREVRSMAKRAILETAGELLRKGYENPVEEMFIRAKERGYGKAREVEAKAEEKVVKPDLAKVAENRKRSAGMAGAAGREDGLISKKAAADMSPAEWKQLDPSEKRRLMSA